MLRVVVLGALGLLVAACMTGPPPGSALPSAASSEPTPVSACNALTLQSPDGQLVFLTGTWIGEGDPNAVPTPSVYYLRQTNDCLVWVGLSNEPGEALGESWKETFQGTIDSTFLIQGRWDWVPEGGRGSIAVQIAFPVVDGAYEMELHLADSTGNIHYVKRWIREGPMP